jgi:hypothetical protein
VGVGAVNTAVEGLACGNPVEPRYREPMPQRTVEEPKSDAGTMYMATDDAEAPRR